MQSHFNIKNIKYVNIFLIDKRLEGYPRVQITNIQ